MEKGPFLAMWPQDKKSPGLSKAGQIAAAHSSPTAPAQAGARGGDRLPVSELGLTPKASGWMFTLKEQTIMSVPGHGPVGMSPEEGHEDDQRLEHLSYEDRLRAGVAQPREGSGETLEQPVST